MTREDLNFPVVKNQYKIFSVENTVSVFINSQIRKMLNSFLYPNDLSILLPTQIANFTLRKKKNIKDKLVINVHISLSYPTMSIIEI